MQKKHIDSIPAEVSAAEQAARLARVRLPQCWKQALAPELTSDRFQNLRHFIQAQKQAGQVIFPPPELIFNAFHRTPLAQVKVVILGQDPYHGAQQANGLCFSVQRGLPLPPSLRNIYHEMLTDVGVHPVKHGDLTAWADQGVLLLNSVLTVNEGTPTSHQKQGWEQFTDAVIDVINAQCDHVVFILWGAYAKMKGERVDPNKHLILTAAHPSPLSANRGGFFGCQVFSKTNVYLERHGLSPISWQLMP